MNERTEQPRVEWEKHTVTTRSYPIHGKDERGRTLKYL
jgi:hypothetical protein